ncbi:DUF563 domain-containing protein [Komagataeibacter xylinus]|nr:glycosyltransferase family 61 protein [Komagataeibacter xylinus]
MKISIKPFFDMSWLRTVEEYREISRQIPQKIIMPPPPWKGASSENLQTGIRRYNAFAENGSFFTPSLSTNLCTIRNGKFLVGHGMDGLILNDDNQPIPNTNLLIKNTNIGRVNNYAIDLPVQHHFDEIFVSFDGAWKNYFHWLTFVIAQGAMAKDILGPDVQIAAPAHNIDNDETLPGYSRDVYNQSIHFSGLRNNIVPLRSGLYSARKIHFFLLFPMDPLHVIFNRKFYDIFEAMQKFIPPATNTPKNIYLARRGNAQERIPPASLNILERELAQRGYTKVHFEGHDLLTQMACIQNAKSIVSPHGAGLTNILFGNSRLRVMEINRQIDGPKNGFRPAYFLFSNALGNRYLNVDGDELGTNSTNITQALDQLEAL